MALKLVEEKLASERFVYEALRRGDTDTVCYRAERNSQWGVRDGNYTNRLRLGYCLWHFGVADEAAWLIFLRKNYWKRALSLPPKPLPRLMICGYGPSRP